VIALYQNVADTLATDDLELASTEPLPTTLRDAPIFALSEDGRFAATSADDAARIVDVQSGSVTREIETDGFVMRGALDGTGENVAMSTQNGVIVSHSGGEVTRWDAAAVGSGSAVGISWDAALLATAERSGELTLWDVASRRELAVLPRFDLGERRGPSYDTVLTIAFNPTADKLAIGGYEGLVLWDIGRDAWVAAACRLSGRQLTPSELDFYIDSDTVVASPCPG
jgi:WD40 repeat protein